MVLNKSLQEINIQNMNVELVAQMFKNYQSNVLFHLEGIGLYYEIAPQFATLTRTIATDGLKEPS
ncbi:MAG: DASH complex subunit dad4 [Bogoriella megaspora]|nr:MAG: DASH complex subunit dad4 [Bogoriella megaspora]